MCPAVKVHPTPETLASVVLVWVASARDLANIQAAAESEAGRRFQFGLYSLYYPKALRQPWLHPLVTPGDCSPLTPVSGVQVWGSQQLLRLRAWWAGEAGLPLVLSVADISPGAGRRTDTGQVRQ